VAVRGLARFTVRGAAIAAFAALLLAPGAGTASAAKPKCFGERATVVGTRGAEILKGTRKADVIVAKEGNDDVRAKGGKDRICGGPGDDILDGGPGRDRFSGGADIDDCLAEATEAKQACEAQLTGAAVAPTPVVGGQASELEAQLEGPAPPGGLVVGASSNNESRASVPSEITVPAGEDSASVDITTTAGPATGVTFTLGLGRRQAQAGISLLAAPPALDEFTLKAGCANAVGQADFLVGQVALDRFATQDTFIQVTSSNQAVATVTGGGTTLTQGNLIGVIGLDVLSAGTTTLTASLDGVQIQREFEARNPGSQVTLTSFDLDPGTVASGGSSTGTVAIDCANISSLTQIDLGQTGTVVSLPAAVGVQAGEETGTFQVNTPFGGPAGATTISATLGATTLEQTLTITE
jgi:hypothetical protein